MSKYSVIAPKKKADLRSHFGTTYKYINAKDIVLDVGCSTGYYARLLIEDKNCIVDGIEIDQKDRLEAQKHLRTVFDVNLDSKTWPEQLLKRRYDIIFLGDVIEHVYSAVDVLQKLKALLKPSGKIIISTPNIAHLTIRLELLSGGFTYEKTGILDETHLKYFTLDSLKETVDNAGFSIMEIDYSLNDLHPDTITHQLKQVGLKPTKDFWKKIDSPEARAYQWRLVLEKSTDKTKKSKATLRRKPMENNYWFAGQVKSLNKENAILSAKIAEKDQWIKQVTDELVAARKTLGWRIDNKLKRSLKR